ncbi:hypothetical protein ANCDUO_03094 [Ancylostoma duodenale]|uniref:Uncharacterized protein n=1 Tax=Ancylostoma duodenale TaxID=51022 RepID=A0A0C2GYK2_9BILA|nr:hypothetical protein ANCDUO_03094 [Ancylostoma duodenale]
MPFPRVFIKSVSLFQIVQLGGISLILAEFATLKAPAKALNDWIAMLTGCDMHSSTICFVYNALRKYLVTTVEAINPGTSPVASAYPST